MPRTLNQLAQGDQTRILDVTGDDAISIRLMEMGLIEGIEIRRVGQAPMGDPIEYAIHGSRLMLRIAEAMRVLIED